MKNYYILRLYCSSLKGIFCRVYSIRFIVVKGKENAPAFMPFLFLAKPKNPSCYSEVNTTTCFLEENSANFYVPFLY